MLLNQRNFFPQYYNRGEYCGFKDYLDDQTEDLLWFLQDASSKQDHPIRRRMDGAGEEEIEAKLQRWRDRQVRQFHERMRQEWRELCNRQLKQRLQRAKGQLQDAQVELQLAAEQLQEAKIELEQAEENLKLEKEYTGLLKALWYCRKCFSRFWD